MHRLPTIPTRTDTLCPYTTLFRFLQRRPARAHVEQFAGVVRPRPAPERQRHLRPFPGTPGCPDRARSADLLPDGCIPLIPAATRLDHGRPPTRLPGPPAFCCLATSRVLLGHAQARPGIPVGQLHVLATALGPKLTRKTGTDHVFCYVETWSVPVLQDSAFRASFRTFALAVAGRSEERRV